MYSYVYYFLLYFYLLVGCFVSCWVSNPLGFRQQLRVLYSTIDLAAMQQYVLPPNSNYSNKLVIVIGHVINFIQYNMYIHTYIYNIESHRFAVVFTVIDTRTG